VTWGEGGARTEVDGHAGLTDAAGHPIAESDELLLVADGQGRFLDASQGILGVLGYTREELLQKTIWDLTPKARELEGLMLWQDFIASGDQTGKYLLRTKAGGLEPFTYEAHTNAAPGVHVSRLRRLR
jgi:PAS domain-containing protein